MKELRVQVRLKNNRLAERREELGLTQKDLAAQVGCSMEAYNSYENLRTNPVHRRGEWKELPRRLAAFHGLAPEELWPEAVRAITVPLAVRRVDVAELERGLAAVAPRALLTAPDEAAQTEEAVTRLRPALARLEAREAQILVARFGLDSREPRGIEELIGVFGVSGQRLRQIEAHALRKLRGRRFLGALAEEDLPPAPPDPAARLRRSDLSAEAEREREHRELLARLHRDDVAPDAGTTAPRAPRFRTPRVPVLVDPSVWLERAVRPGPCAHAVPRAALELVEHDGRALWSVAVGTAARCGELLFPANLPTDAHGLTWRFSTRPRCPECWARAPHPDDHGGPR